MFVKVPNAVKNGPLSLRILVIGPSYIKTVPGDRKMGHKPWPPAGMPLPKKPFIHYISFIPAGWKTVWNIIP